MTICSWITVINPLLLSGYCCGFSNSTGWLINIAITIRLIIPLHCRDTVELHHKQHICSLNQMWISLWNKILIQLCAVKDNTWNFSRVAILYWKWRTQYTFIIWKVLNKSWIQRKITFMIYYETCRVNLDNNKFLYFRY